MPAFDYQFFAPYYDTFASFTTDLPLYMDAVRRHGPKVLELMAGTGRVSLPLARERCALTCVDSSMDMLSVLRDKLVQAKLAARVVCGDACSLPFSSRFDLILLPFQGFSELIETADQRRVLSSIARCLAPEGRFLCTLHNPPVKQKELDGAWHTLGPFEDPCGPGTIRLRYRGRPEPKGKRVVGRQKLEIYNEAGEKTREQDVELTYSLLGRRAFESLAGEAGFHTVELYGDYEYGAYIADQSPCMIWVLGKR